MRIRECILSGSLLLSACSSSHEVQDPNIDEISPATVQPHFSADQASAIVADYEGELNGRLEHEKRLPLGAALGWCTVWTIDGRQVAVLNPVLAQPRVASPADIEFAHIPFASSLAHSTTESYAQLDAGPYVIEGFYADEAISPGMALRWYENATGPKSIPTGTQGLVQPQEVTVTQTHIGENWYLVSDKRDPISFTFAEEPGSESSDSILCMEAEVAAAALLQQQ